jgi:hypothetical protein
MRQVCISLDEAYGNGTPAQFSDHLSYGLTRGRKNAVQPGEGGGVVSYDSNGNNNNAAANDDVHWAFPTLFKPSGVHPRASQICFLMNKMVRIAFNHLLFCLFNN